MAATQQVPITLSSPLFSPSQRQVAPSSKPRLLPRVSNLTLGCEVSPLCDRELVFPRRQNQVWQLAHAGQPGRRLAGGPLVLLGPCA